MNDSPGIPPADSEVTRFVAETERAIEEGCPPPDPAGLLTRLDPVRRDILRRVISDTRPSVADNPFVPGFRIERELGRGGMGIVYLARHLALDRPVALKLIRDDAVATAEARQRFQAEAKVVARFQHPHLVRVLEVGSVRGRDFVAFEYVDGGTLADRIGEYRDPMTAARLMMTLARAVQLAHDAGVIHRDLKPANILLQHEAGRSRDNAPALTPKIADFGLAKLTDAEPGLTRTGDHIGTPAYMAPEQANGRSDEIGPRTDIHALGVILYECLAGQTPFGIGAAHQIMARVVEQTPKDLRSSVHGVPRDLATICHKCLEKRPSDRYGSATALADDLGRFIRGEPILARRAGMLERLGKWSRRNRLASLVIAGSLLMTMVTGTMAVFLMRTRFAEAEKRESLARVQYALDIHRAGRAWRSGDLVPWQETLARYRPRKGEPDRRGFEWHYWDRKQLSPIASHARRATSLRVFSDNGRAVSTEGRSVAVWDFMTGSDHWRHTMPEEASALALASDGRRVATATRSGRIMELDASAGQTLGEFQAGGPVTALAYLPNQPFLFVGLDRKLALWDCNSTKLIHSVDTEGPVECIAVHPGGQRLVFIVRVFNTSGAAEVSIFDCDWQLEHLAVRSRNSARGNRCLFRPNGQELFLLGKGECTSLIDYSGKLTSYLLHTNNRTDDAVTYSPDGRWLAVGANGVVTLWEADTWKPLVRLPVPAPRCHDLAVTQDGRHLVSAAGKSVQVWSLTDAASCLDEEEKHRSVVSVAVDSNGIELSAGLHDGGVGRWDLATGRRLSGLAIPEQPYALAYSPDGRWLATGGEGKVVRLWDRRDMSLARVLAGHTDFIWCAAFSPDGRALATCGSDGTVRLWDPRAGECVREIDVAKDRASGDRKRVLVVAWHPDGRELAAGCADGLTRIWSIATDGSPRLKQELVGHADEVFSVAYRPDGKEIATAGWDMSIRLWDCVTGRPGRTMNGHEGRIWSVAYSPTEPRLASGSWDGSVRIWDLSTGEEVFAQQSATSRITRVLFAPDGRLAVGGLKHGVRLLDGRPRR